MLVLFSVFVDALLVVLIPLQIVSDLHVCLAGLADSHALFVVLRSLVLPDGVHLAVLDFRITFDRCDVGLHGALLTENEAAGPAVVPPLKETKVFTTFWI